MKFDIVTAFSPLSRIAWASLLAMGLGMAGSAPAQPTTVTVQVGTAGKPISPDLFGIFFEDINYAADGGLYAELVQNRSFEYSPEKAKGWDALTAWKLVQRDGGQGTLAVETSSPLNAGNPHYAVLTSSGAGGVGLENEGFDGITLTAGDKYDVSLFARQLAGPGALLTVRLESKAGDSLGEVTLPPPSKDWQKRTATIEAVASSSAARLVVLAKQEGRLALDMVSLFPQKTFHNRPNGLRADLGRAIAGLHPKFMRFPGGCLVHGNGLDNMYRWKNTIGPIEQRVTQRNIWHYDQSAGLGYFEYFQFCEDIGAKPLPVVAAGVCCQGSNSTSGKGQAGLPMADMPAYVQEVLDLIEYANGPVTSIWGAKRAAAGHPASFHLEYLGVGNEDNITPIFRERFQMIHAAIKARYPEITVVGTVGPGPDGPHFDNGWKFADELRLAIMDEHYYKAPQWFWNQLRRYDTYDRHKSKVYVGEYAAHDEKRRPTLRAAIAEAAYMTQLERNGDVVAMASYAPLLAKLGHTQWHPDLIYFTNTEILPTISYHVQQLFGVNGGDSYLTTSVADAADFAASTVRDSKTGDLILKLVNGANAARPLHIEFIGAQGLSPTAIKTVLANPDANVVNEHGQPPAVLPRTSPIAISPVFDYEAPANSLTVIRVPAR